MVVCSSGYAALLATIAVLVLHLIAASFLRTSIKDRTQC